MVTLSLLAAVITVITAPQGKLAPPLGHMNAGLDTTVARRQMYLIHAKMAHTSQVHQIGNASRVLWDITVIIMLQVIIQKTIILQKS